MTNTGVNIGGSIYDADEKDVPVMMGSGGGSSSGGQGGGLIHIYVDRYLHLLSGALISADGTSASGTSTGGGGSGGTIYLKTPTLGGEMASQISANGGGSGTGGGGGGGGYIVLNQNFTLSQYGGFNGTVESKGGSSIALGTSGQIGLTYHIPHCGAGSDGILCTECGLGFFKPNISNELCQPCRSGSFANRTGSTTCHFCANGTYQGAGAETSCSVCPSGSSSHEGAINCTVCDPGTFSVSKPDVPPICTPCPSNTKSLGNQTVCTPCDRGQFSGIGASFCRNCTNRPEHSTYVSGGATCAYKCDPGFVYPKCITPFQQLIDRLGGPYFFLAIVMGICVVVFLPFIFCWTRSRNRRRAQKEADLLEFASDFDSTTPVKNKGDGRDYGTGIRRSSTTPNYYNAYHQLSPKVRRDRNPDDGVGMHNLNENDLDILLHRIYFGGTNSWNDPLRLSPSPGREISPLILSEEYRDFAEKISAFGRWQSWEIAVYVLLFLFYYPAAVEFHHHRQEKHVLQMLRFHSSCNFGFLKNHTARALGGCLRFGYSPCNTVVWIDFLCVDENDVSLFNAGKPTLPMVLQCSGDGSYFAPYHLDITDPFVKCLSDYFGAQWFTFVSHLNTHLRTVSTSHPESCLTTMRYLNMMNRHGIGIGSCMPLEGLSVKLAFSKHGGENGYHPVVVIDQADDQTVDLSRKSSTPNRLESSPAASSPAPSSLDDSNTRPLLNMSDVDRRDFPHSPPSSSVIMPWEKPTSSSRPRPILPYDTLMGFEFLEKVEGRSTAANFFRTLLRPFGLYNTRARYTKTKMMFLITLLLSCYLILIFAIGAAFIQIIPYQYVVSVLVLPLADILTPVVGLSAVGSGSVSIARHLSHFNIVSFVNASLVLTFGIMALGDTGFYGILFPILMLVTKLLLAYANNIFVAQLELARDLRLSRRDYLRNKRDQGSNRKSSRSRKNPTDATSPSMSAGFREALSKATPGSIMARSLAHPTRSDSPDPNGVARELSFDGSRSP